MRSPRTLAFVVAVVAVSILLARGPQPEETAGPPAADTPIGTPAGTAPTGEWRSPSPPPAPQAGPPTPRPPSPRSTPAAALTFTPHDSVATGDGELSVEAAAPARAVAEEFARVWSTPHERWHERLAALATPQLAAALTGAEPVHPPPQVSGPGTVLLAAPEWAQVRVPTDRGRLLLDLVRVRDGWRVSAVDWQRP